MAFGSDLSKFKIETLLAFLNAEWLVFRDNVGICLIFKSEQEMKAVLADWRLYANQREMKFNDPHIDNEEAYSTSLNMTNTTIEAKPALLEFMLKLLFSLAKYYELDDKALRNIEMAMFIASQQIHQPSSLPRATALLWHNWFYKAQYRVAEVRLSNSERIRTRRKGQENEPDDDLSRILADIDRSLLNRPSGESVPAPVPLPINQALRHFQILPPPRLPQRGVLIGADGQVELRVLRAKAMDAS